MARRAGTGVFGCLDMAARLRLLHLNMFVCLFKVDSGRQR